MGFFAERPYFYQHLSLQELLAFHGQLCGMARDQYQERITKLLERVDLTRFGSVPLRKFSKGMLQRVGLCQALLHSPELLILDEPMSGLDPLGRALVRELILEGTGSGMHNFLLKSHSS